MSRAVMQRALDALVDVARDLAKSQCDYLYAALGHRSPRLHDAAKRELEQIESAIEALGAALALQQTVVPLTEQQLVKHPADALADDLGSIYGQLDPVDDWRPVIGDSVDMLCTIPALEAARDQLRSEVAALCAAAPKAAPQPAAAAPVPLTEEQREGIIGDSDGRWNDGEFRIGGAGLVELINAVERAHGIGSRA